MLKVYYSNCCGMDVHKKFVVATIAKTDEHKVTTYQTKQFSTLPKDLQLLKSWLVNDNDCKEVCMESTGKYWIPIFNILEDSCHVVVTHPKYVRAIPGKKPTRKTLFGLLIFLNTVLLVLVLFLLVILDSFVI